MNFLRRPSELTGAVLQGAHLDQNFPNQLQAMTSLVTGEDRSTALTAFNLATWAWAVPAC